MRLLRFAAVLLLGASVAVAQEAPPRDFAAWDSEIRHGDLPDGTSFFVRRLESPAGRFSARLVLKAGSVVEGEDERGLMHLLEHLGFAGSESFASGEMARRVEAHGMRFGPDLNAFTGYEKITYELELPSSAESLDLAVAMLRDWAGGATLSDEAIEKERGIVLAERRLSRDAPSLADEESVGLLLAGTRQAGRYPIGTEAAIRDAPADVIRSLYRTWWHPGLLAVVVAGDVDAAAVETALRARFLPRPGTAASAPTLPAPGSPTPGAAARVVTSDAIGTAWLRVAWSGPWQPEPRDQMQQFRKAVLEAVGPYLMDFRLSGMTLAGTLPVSAGYEAMDDVGRVEIGMLAAGPRRGREIEGLTALRAELARMATHGPTPGELSRAVGDVTYGYRRSLAQRTNDDMAEALVQAFLDDDVLRSEADELALLDQVTSTIDAASIREWFASAAAAPRVTAMLAGPPPLPSDAELLAALQAPAEPPPQVAEIVAPVRLVAQPPPSTGRARRVPEPDVGGTWLLYPNGLRVLVVPNDGAEDEVLVAAWTRDDLPDHPSWEQHAGMLAAECLPWIGAAGIPPDYLQAWLVGHRAKLWTDVGTFGWTLRGEATSDLDPLLERLHALFTTPAIDGPAFGAMRSRIAKGLAGRYAEPMTRLFLETEKAMLGEAPGWQRPAPESLESVTADEAEKAWRRVRTDASRWTIVVVGSTTTQAVAASASRWLASLPGSPDAGAAIAPWPDVPRRAPGHHVRDVRLPGEASLVIAGCMLRNDEGSLPELEIALLKDVLDQRISRQLRDERGTTYVAKAGVAGVDPHPREGALVALADVPESLRGEVGRILRAELRDLATRGPTAQETALVKGQALADLAAPGWSNDALLERLLIAVRRGVAPESTQRESARVASVTPDGLRRVARRWLDFSTTFDVAVLPQHEAASR